ncbi:MAG: metallophosphoesterase [Sarcina sp.]
MATYVVSDIHNANKTFIKMLEVLRFSNDDKLIINGDLIDRKGNTKPFIKFLQNQKNITYILGNHEKMFMDAYETGYLFEEPIEMEENYIFSIDDEVSKKIWVHTDRVCNHWFRNGGKYTLDSLNKKEIDWLYNYYKNECSYYKVVDNNLFVHAGPFIEVRDYTEEELIEWLENQTIRNLIWDREFFNRFCVEKNFSSINLPYNVFVGHNSIKSSNLRFEVVSRTDLENGKKIIATDYSDTTGKYNSMAFYCIETENFYVADKGEIYKYDYIDHGLGQAYIKTEYLGDY